MQFVILSIGKNKQQFIKDGIDLYSQRLQHYCKFEFIMPPEIKNSGALSKEKLKQKEAEQYNKSLKDGDYIILLDEKGKSYSSREFASRLEWLKGNSKKRTVFIIGGAYGFSDDLIKKADAKISLSKMTFSHQLIRLIFLEQLYRGFTILAGEKYHND